MAYKKVVVCCNDDRRLDGKTKLNKIFTPENVNHPKMNNNKNDLKNNTEEHTDVKYLYPSVKNAIMKIAEKEGYFSPNIHTRVISAEGGNVFGVLYEVNIKGETAEGNKPQINLFVKHVIPNSDSVKLLSVSEIYNKEIFVYTEVAKIINELQNQANIPVEERFKLVKIYDESSVDAIILENMSKQGFKTYSKMDVMNINYAKLCIENLAKFHGLAFIIEKKMPDFFEYKIKSLKQTLVIDTSYKVYANNVYKLTTQKFNTDLKYEVDKWWKIAIEDYSKYVNGKKTDTKCLCHGDFKTNNVMYKEMEGKITEVITVDYQLAHYGSPVLDFIYFICMGTDQKFRRKHLEYLKDHYHVSLKKYLEYFNVLVDDVYPRELFEKDFEDCLDYALVSCICVLPFSLSVDHEVPDLVENEIINVGFKLDDTYYDRLKGVFEDFFKWGR